MEQYRITIAREFGSLGRSIAKRLAELLGVGFYDREIVEAVAKEMQLPLSTISMKEEKTSTGLLYRLFPLGTDEEDIQDAIFDAQRGIIMDLADRESCVIVGRCSDYLLEEHRNSLSVYIHAPLEIRIQNCVRYLNMQPEEAERTIHSVDRARNAYHRKYAGYLPSDPAHKHFCIDSSVLGVEGTAQLLAEVVRKRFGEA